VPGGVTDLDALVQRLAGPLEASLKPGQRLVLDLAGDLPAVAGDEPSLVVLFEQLANNAREALALAAGEIEVRTSSQDGSRNKEQEREAEVFLPFSALPLPSSARVCLEVRDSGAGLSAEARARLFEPFFSTHSGRRGTGLATVLGIVRGLRGAVEVCSKPGQGSTFRVLLPAATVPAPSRSGLAPGLPTHSVLDVVGRHAAEVRVVLVDLVMPRLSGEQVLEELRRLAPRLPVLVMSGHPAHEVVPRLAPLGLTGYLQKPFRLPTLLAAVRPYLSAGAVPAGNG
jgi:CheY-like chemotaxis protein